MKNKIILLILLVSIGLVGVYFFVIKDNRTIKNHEDASNYNKVIKESNKKPSVTPKTADKLRHQENEEITNHIAAFESAFYSQNREQLFKEAEAIKKLGKEAIPQLLDIIANKEYKVVFRKMAFELIRDIGPSAGEVNLLIRIMKDKTDDPLIRGEAAWALGLTGSVEVVDSLIEILSDKTEDLRLRKLSATSLGLIGDTRAEDLLIFTALDKNENSKVRTASINALGHIKTSKAVDTAIYSLGDESWSVQIASANVLSKFTDDKVVQALNDQLIIFIDNENSDVKDAVVESIINSLSEIKSPNSVPALIEVLKGKDNLYSALAGKALGEIGDKRALLPIEDALKNAIDPFEIRLLSEAQNKLSGE